MSLCWKLKLAISKTSYLMIIQWSWIVFVGSPLLRGWYGSQSTSSEHALNTIVVSWKWYDFLKLVETKDLLIRVLFRVQWVVLRDHVLSTWSRFMPGSMNRHWHLFKMIVVVSLYSSNIRLFVRLIYWLSRSGRYWFWSSGFYQCWLTAVYESVVS
jgi:hypothetical protein